MQDYFKYIYKYVQIHTHTHTQKTKIFPLKTKQTSSCKKTESPVGFVIFKEGCLKNPNSFLNLFLKNEN